jgi:hypothetical protein
MYVVMLLPFIRQTMHAFFHAYCHETHFDHRQLMVSIVEVGLSSGLGLLQLLNLPGHLPLQVRDASLVLNNPCRVGRNLRLLSLLLHAQRVSFLHAHIYTSVYVVSSQIALP